MFIYVSFHSVSCLIFCRQPRNIALQLFKECQPLHGNQPSVEFVVTRELERILPVSDDEFEEEEGFIAARAGRKTKYLNTSTVRLRNSLIPNLAVAHSFIVQALSILGLNTIRKVPIILKTHIQLFPKNCLH